MLMRRLAVLATLLALSGFAVAGSALAQDEGGGTSSDGSSTSTPDTSPPEAAPAPDDAVMDDAAALAAGCPAGSTKGACAALTNTDPFAATGAAWNGSSFDTAPAPGAPPGPRMGAAY
jgi:hypothetical protein